MTIPQVVVHRDKELMAQADAISDERLRLIFVCCHPAIAPDARAAVTLKLVCGLSTERLARAFLVEPPAMLQRITRAKRKVREAGVPFEVPGPEAWPERLDAVSDEVFLDWRRRGWIPAIYAHLHSASQWGRLIDLAAVSGVRQEAVGHA